MENDGKYLPELLAEKDSLDASFTHAMKLLNAGKKKKLSIINTTGGRLDLNITRRCDDVHVVDWPVNSTDTHTHNKPFDDHQTRGVCERRAFIPRVGRRPPVLG